MAERDKACGFLLLLLLLIIIIIMLIIIITRSKTCRFFFLCKLTSHNSTYSL